MIKSNARRKPGSINNTPAIKRKTEQNYNQNLYPTFQNQTSESQGQYWIQLNAMQESNSNDEQNKYQTKKKKEIIERMFDMEFSNSGITNIEQKLGGDCKLHLVKRLNLSQNNIGSFASTVFNKLQNMNEMLLSHNRIQKISFPYFKQNKIQLVNISNNRISSLNLQHLQSLTDLDCSQNQISFLTLPPSLKLLNCKMNKLSNIYFMQICHSLQYVNMAHNLFYDLKFNFKPYIKFKQQKHSQDESGQIRYKYLKHLDCSFNKIQYFQGMINVINLQNLIINNNNLALTRHMINQLILLQHLQLLNIDSNPIEEAGFTHDQIYNMLNSKIPALLYYNGESIQENSRQDSGYSSNKKSMFSLMEEPYQLFMESEKKNKTAKTARNLQWNFTLGDCDNQKQQIKINDLSDIQEIKIADLNQSTLKGNQDQKIQFKAAQKNIQPIKIEDYVKTEERELKLKVIKSQNTTSLSMPHHIHYEPFLKTLLSLSYVPTRPIIHQQSKISSTRLQQYNDDYLLISKMFMNRGGVVYVKKVMEWLVRQQNQQIFNRHCGQLRNSQMGFLMSQLNQKQFKQLCKYSKLLKRQERDIIGMQPNVFSCYHIIVRYGSPNDDEYKCAYLIESAHL